MEDFTVNPLYAMINCPICEDLVEFGDDWCDLCQADLDSEFWAEAYDTEVLTIAVPVTYPWDVSEAYNNRTLAERNCDECLWYQTDQCKPLIEWLHNMSWGEEPSEMDSIHPCSDFTTSTS